MSSLDNGPRRWETTVPWPQGFAEYFEAIENLEGVTVTEVNAKGVTVEIEAEDEYEMAMTVVGLAAELADHDLQVEIPRPSVAPVSLPAGRSFGQPHRPEGDDAAGA